MSLDATSHLNDGNIYAETIPAAAAGTLLLDFLACRYSHSSREAWAAHGEAGRVRLDAAPAAPDAVLRAGQLLEYHRPPWLEPSAPRWLWTLFADEHVLVLLKPSGSARTACTLRLHCAALRITGEENCTHPHRCTPL